MRQIVGRPTVIRVRTEHLVQTLLASKQSFIDALKVRCSLHNKEFDSISFFVLHRLIAFVPTYFASRVSISVFQMHIFVTSSKQKTRRKKRDERNRVRGYIFHERSAFFHRVEKRLCDAEILISAWKTRLELTDNRIRGGKRRKQMLLPLFSLSLSSNFSLHTSASFQTNLFHRC